MVTDITKTKKYKLALARQRARNAKFRKLPIARQRVAIARDVIKLLSKGKIKARSTYLNSPVETATRYRSADLGVALTCGECCEVCGIGSLFVATVMTANHVKVEDFHNSDDARQFEVDYLEKWFDYDQLTIIEMHYELRNEAYGFTSMGAKKTADARMVMIMENIISNGGRFIPSRGEHAVRQTGPVPCDD